MRLHYDDVCFVEIGPAAYTYQRGTNVKSARALHPLCPPIIYTYLWSGEHKTSLSFSQGIGGIKMIEYFFILFYFLIFVISEISTSEHFLIFVSEKKKKRINT